MTNLQIIKKVAKECGLTFERQNATINGARLYSFKNEFGTVIAQNWTISSAINEHNFGDLHAKIR